MARIKSSDKDKATYTDKVQVPAVSYAKAMGSYVVDPRGNVWSFATCPADNFLQLIRQYAPAGKSYVLDTELKCVDLSDEFARWFILDLMTCKRIRVSIPLYDSVAQAEAASRHNVV